MKQQPSFPGLRIIKAFIKVCWPLHYKEAELYESLRPVICINLLDFELLKETGRIHNCFLLKEKQENHLLTDQLALHFLELPKFQDFEKTGKLEEWMIYFLCEGKEEEEKKDLMSRIMKNNKEIQETHDRYNSFKADEEKRMLYEARMKMQRDYNQGLHTSYQKGKKEGLSQGIEQGELRDKKKVLVRLMKKKFSISQADEDFIMSVNEPDKLDSALDEEPYSDSEEWERVFNLVDEICREAGMRNLRVASRGQKYSIGESAVSEYCRWQNMPWE